MSCVYILFSISGFQISNSSRAYQLGCLTDVAFARCLAWLPVPELEGVIAIGQMNGRVMLTSVLGSGETSPLNGKEYASKHNRQCNTLAWGLAEPYVLAAGFDKHRSEHGLILWDVTKGGSDGNRPFLESAFGDTITSVTWFSHSQTMAAGVNNKQLRLYDLRGKKVQHDFLPLTIVTLLIYFPRWTKAHKFNKYSCSIFNHSGSFC